MKNIIIDCDPGHDDAIAIFMALAHKDKLNLLGITTVGGNHIVEKITLNALKILSFVNEDIKVAKGAEKPLLRPLRTGADAHGDTGMDGPLLPEPKFQVVEENAVEFMADLIKNTEGKITLVPTGPLTNIALLLKAYPELTDKIEEISLMGGAALGGNVTPCAEFNIYVDPEAAKIVFDAGIPIIMSGLDVTHRAEIWDEEIEEFHRMGKVSKLVGELLDFYGQVSKRFGFVGSPLHDVCAVAWLLKPEIFTAKPCQVDVEIKSEVTRGMTVVNSNLQEGEIPNATVLFDVDRDRFAEMLFESLRILDARQE